MGGLSRWDPMELNGVMEINILYFDWDLDFKDGYIPFLKLNQKINKTELVEHLRTVHCVWCEVCLRKHGMEYT